MKKGSIVELVEDTQFYKKGKRAVVISECDSQNGNKQKMEIRYEGVEYEGYDVDVVPRHLFRMVSV